MNAAPLFNFTPSAGTGFMINRLGLALGLATVWVAAFPSGGDAASSPAPGSERVAILSRQAFPAELKGWGQLGPAIFAADTNKTCEGLASARITVASDTELKYQQLRREFTEGIQPRDEYFMIRPMCRSIRLATCRRRPGRWP